MLEVDPALLGKESDQVRARNAQADPTQLPKPIPDLPHDPADGRTATSGDSATLFSAINVAKLLQRRKLADRMERQLSRQLRAKVPPLKRHLTRVERHIAQYILEHKDAPSRFLLRHFVGTLKDYYGQHAVAASLVIGLSTRDFKLVEASLNQFTNDELRAISGTWLHKLRQLQAEAKELEFREIKLKEVALRQLETKKLDRSRQAAPQERAETSREGLDVETAPKQTEPESDALAPRRPTLFERYAMHFVLKRKNKPIRFLMRQSMGAIKRLYGDRAILALLVMGIDSRDSKLIDASLKRFAHDEFDSVSASWPKAYADLSSDVSELEAKDIGDNKDLLKWLQQQLVLRLEAIMTTDPAAARTFIDKATTLLNDLLKSVGVEEVAKTAGALAAIGPKNPVLLQLLGHCEKWSGRLENARVMLEQAVAFGNVDPMVYFELSEVLEFLGDDAGAIQAARRGQEHFSDQELFLKNPGCMTMPAGPLMRQGDLAAGWRQYQKRRDRFVLDAPPGTAIWQGESLEDTMLLVLAEKGVGDEIRYASCYPDLLSRVSNVAVSADPRLVSLLARSFPEITFIPASRNTVRNWKKKSIQRETFKLSRALSLDLYCLASQFDHLCMAGDLPLYLRSEPTAFPRHQGYLVPDTAKREIWRERLAELGPGLKVGISWRSASKTYKRDQHYFALEQILPVLQVPGVHFVNLQYDECEVELASLEQKHGIAVHRWSEANLKDDIDGVAALMKELDLVIAPHTMVKELSGAVGTPTLFMAPTGQAWVRWRAYTESKEDIWHPSMIHMQSARAGDKDDVIAKTKEQLGKIVAAQGFSKGWHPAKSGLHADSKEVSLEKPAAPPVEEASPNEYGETYAPAGADRFPDKALRAREWAKRSQNFDEACVRLMQGLEQPRDPKGVLLICGQGSLKQHALTVYGVRGLLEHGWTSVILDGPPIYTKPYAKPAIAHFQQVLLADDVVRRRYRHRDWPDQLNFNWEIDWDNRLCRAEGINFYPIIANRLGKEFRRYSVDIADAKVATRFETLVQSCDAALRVCLDAEEQLAPLGIPVRFTGFEPNYPPTGVFKVYCGERGWRHGIEFVEIRQAYEKYFRAGRTGFVNAIEVQNVTRHRLYSAAGLRGDRFDAWLNQDGKDDAVAKRGEAWATQNRSGHREPTPEGKVVLDRIRRHREHGGKVACLYGCIPFDFGHPWPDSGPGHSDLADWYNHTVETLNNTDVLLLVKPHPSEADFEQFGYPEEFFVEMLKAKPAKNIALLGHRWLNNADLRPHLDFGIIWRGSIATELALLGVPVVVCAPYSMTDHVLDFPMPKDRADYEDMLRNSDRIQLSEQLKQRAARVFEFYRTEGMIEYPFGWISSKRKDAGPPVLSEGAIKTYLANGHPSVDEMCRRIIADEDD